MSMKRKSKEIKRIARDILNNRYNVPMGAFVTASLIPTVIEIPFSLSLGEYPGVFQLIILLLAECIIALIAQILNAGVVHVHMNLTRRRDCKISQVFFPFRNGLDRFFGSALLLGALSLISCLPAIGGGIYFYYTKLSSFSVLIFVLSVLVSVIFCLLVTLNFNFAAYFLLDYPEMKVAVAYKESRRLMKKNKVRFFYLLCSFLGWGFLILCSFGIATLWISPYMNQTMVVFYLDCTGELDRIPVVPSNADASESRSTVY